MRTPPAVRLATEADIPALAEALAKAFFEDPLMPWLWPDPDLRRAMLPRFFRRAVRVFFADGLAYTTADGVRGAAVWSPPGEPPTGRLLRQVRSGILAFGARQSAETIRRMIAAERVNHRHARAATREPHWVLQILGVDPASQGQGVAGALLRPVLDRADRERAPCWLGTLTETNVAIYRRFGFETIAEDRFGRGGPRFWSLRRRPR